MISVTELVQDTSFIEILIQKIDTTNSITFHVHALIMAPHNHTCCATKSCSDICNGIPHINFCGDELSSSFPETIPDICLDFQMNWIPSSWKTLDAIDYKSIFWMDHTILKWKYSNINNQLLVVFIYIILTFSFLYWKYTTLN